MLVKIYRTVLLALLFACSAFSASAALYRTTTIQTQDSRTVNLWFGKGIDITPKDTMSPLGFLSANPPTTWSGIDAWMSTGSVLLTTGMSLGFTEEYQLGDSSLIGDTNYCSNIHASVQLIDSSTHNVMATIYTLPGFCTWSTRGAHTYAVPTQFLGHTAYLRMHITWGGDPSLTPGIAGGDSSNSLPSGSLCSFAKRASAIDLLPSSLIVAQNYPNPFNPTTTVQYTTTVAGAVTLRVRNILGQNIYSRTTDEKAGTHTAVLDLSGFPTGRYLYEIESDGVMASKSMIFTK